MARSQQHFDHPPAQDVDLPHQLPLCEAADRRDRFVALAKKGKPFTTVKNPEGKDKTGVFTGAHAVNPVNGERIPVWIADYVLINDNAPQEIKAQ